MTTFWLVVGSLLFAQGASAEPVRARFVEAELVSEVHAVKAGESFWAGVRLAMDPEWHTYWRNPGDSGLPTTIEWDLPEGFRAGEIQWPSPQRFEHPPYVSYGYEDEVLLIAEITPPVALSATDRLSLSARADWTVCREDLCIPGGADLTLEIATTADEPEVDRYWHGHFEKTRARLPRRSQDWTATAAAEGGAIRLTLSPVTPRDPGTITVFERDRNTIDHEKPVALNRSGDTIELRLALDGDAPDRLSAVLLAERHWDDAGRVKALDVSVPVAR